MRERIGSQIRDVRFALRAFTRNPQYALAATLTIALAIGAAAAVFSVVDRSLFRPLPYRFQSRLVSVGIVAPVISTQDWLFAGTYQEWQSAQTAFEAMTAWAGVRDCDRTDQSPERLGCAQVQANFLPTLGVHPILGRNFTEQEDLPGADPVALIGYGFWKARFAGDPTAIGTRVAIDGIPIRIVGVLPPDFETPNLQPAQVVLPLMLRQGSQRQRLVKVIGRLRPGMSAESAAASLTTLFERFAASAPADFRKAVPTRLRVATLRDQQIRSDRQALWMLLGAVLAFVLLACTNVANLLLARSASRRHEFAVRMALGASRWRLARQALTESVLLGTVGGIAGCLVADALLRVFRSLAPEGALRMRQAQLDPRVLAFACLLSAGAALLFGMAPIWERLRAETMNATRTASARIGWLRPLLISAQLSISLVLLTGSGLFLLSLWHLQRTSLGFTPEHVETGSFVLPAKRYAGDSEQIRFFQELEQRLEAMPGVVAAAITDSLPPTGDPRSRPFVALLGAGGNAADQGLEGLVKWRYVTPGYFRALGIPIRRGRPFTKEDRFAGDQPIVISESLARRLFGAKDPIGERLHVEVSPVVVGVAADVHNAGIEGTPDPEFYAVRRAFPDALYRNQRPPLGWRSATAVVRSTLQPPAAAALLQSAIHQLDPELAVAAGSMERQVVQLHARPRFQSVLLSAFAVAGLMLAAIGLYGLVSYLVTERTREIGVRMALGASRGEIVKMVIAGGLRWTISGILVGLAASAWLFSLMQSLLYEVQAMDWRIFGCAAVLLVAVGILATLSPSLRASRIDPAIALRHE